MSLLDLSPVVRAIAQDKTAYQTSIILAGYQPEKYGERARKYLIERFKGEFDIDMGTKT